MMGALRLKGQRIKVGGQAVKVERQKMNWGELMYMRNASDGNEKVGGFPTPYSINP